MKTVDEIKIDLLAKFGEKTLEESRKVSPSEIFAWENRAKAIFPDFVKEYLGKIGLFEFDHSFYECCDTGEYVGFPKESFIKLLLDEQVPANNIRPIDFRFESDGFDSEVMQHIFKLVGADHDECFDIAVRMFPDEWGYCTYLMLTGNHQNYIAEESFIDVAHGQVSKQISHYRTVGHLSTYFQFDKKQ